MDKDTLTNWQRIKDHFEAIGKTDNYYYHRANMIVKAGLDPLEIVAPAQQPDALQRMEDQKGTD